MTAATALGFSPTVNPSPSVAYESKSSSRQVTPKFDANVARQTPAGSLQQPRSPSDIQVALGPAAAALPAITIGQALLIIGALGTAYQLYTNLSSEADRAYVLDQVGKRVQQIIESVPGFKAPSIGDLKRDIRALFSTLNAAGGDFNNAKEAISKWVHERSNGETTIVRNPQVPVPAIPPTSTQANPAPSPVKTTTQNPVNPAQTPPTPAAAPTTKTTTPPTVATPPAPAPQFNAQQLTTRIQSFAPKFAGVTPAVGVPLKAVEAKFLADAAQYNRAGGNLVAVCVKFQYWDPGSKQSVDGVLLYKGLEPSKVLTQFENFSKKVDATKAFNLIGDLSSRLGDVGLSINGLQSRVRGASDASFAKSLPTAGGRQASPGASNDYEAAKGTVATNNKKTLALGHIDKLDLIVPCKDGRHFFMQGVTRGEASGLLNWAGRTDQLRDGVTARDVIRANGLDSVLGQRGEKVVPLTLGKVQPRSLPGASNSAPKPASNAVASQPTAIRKSADPQPQRVGWFNPATNTFSSTRQGSNDLEVTARFVTQLPKGAKVMQVAVNPVTGEPSGSGEGSVNVDVVARPIPNGIQLDVTNPNPPPDDQDPKKGGGNKWKLAAIAGAVLPLGWGAQSIYSGQIAADLQTAGQVKIDLAAADKIANTALSRLNKNSTPAEVKAVRKEIWSAYLNVGTKALEGVHLNKGFNVVPMPKLFGDVDIATIKEGVEAHLKRLDSEPLPVLGSYEGRGPLPNNIEIAGDATKTQHISATLGKAGEAARDKVAQIPQRMSGETPAAAGDRNVPAGELSFKPFPVVKLVQDSQATTLTGASLLKFQTETRQKINLHFLQQVTPRVKQTQRAEYTQTVAAWVKNDTQDVRTLLTALGRFDKDTLALVDTALGKSKLAQDELHRRAPNVALSVADGLGQALKPTATPVSTPPPTATSVSPKVNLPTGASTPAPVPTQREPAAASARPKSDPGLATSTAYRERLTGYTQPTLGYINAAMVPGAVRLTKLDGFKPTEAMFIDKRLTEAEGLYQAAVKLKTLQEQIGSNYKVLSVVANDIARDPNRSNSPALLKLEREIAELGKNWNEVGVLQNRINDRLKSLPSAPPPNPSVAPAISPEPTPAESLVTPTQPPLNVQPTPSESTEPALNPPPNELTSPTPPIPPTPQPATQP